MVSAKLNQESIHAPLRKVRLQLIGVGALLLALSIGLRAAATTINRREIAQAIAQSVERNLQMGDFREAMFSLGHSVHGIFSGIEYVEAASQQEHLIFAMGEPKSLLGIGLIRYPLPKGASSIEGAELRFYFDPFEGLSILALLMIPAFSALGWIVFRRAEMRFRQQLELMSLTRDAEGRAQLATQVAHDIRSPLAALTMAEHDFQSLPEDTRVMVRSAVSRIRDIANHLLEKNRISAKSGAAVPSQAQKEEELAPVFISSLIEGILTEKRMQFRSRLGVEIEFHPNRENFGLFANVQPAELKRVLSNLINNAVEALFESGKIILSLQGGNDEVALCVRDTGKGIPPEILARLTGRGETHGKKGGSGLGLYHARLSCEMWGGRLEIASEAGKGTEVTLKLPRVRPPGWFVDRLRIPPQSRVVILDDDQSVHSIWQNRFESLRAQGQGVDLIHFSTPEDLRKDCKIRGKDLSSLYLIDYELLSYKDTGLDLIEELGIARRAVLVTSRYDEPAIRERCLKLTVPLIPKGMAGFVPIVIAS